MATISDLIGKKYNMLTALQFEYTRKGNSYWLFECDCGTQKILRGSQVVYGSTISCGCYKDGILRTHDLYYHPLYHVWNAMMQRCYNPNQVGFANYGGRGITVSDRWKQVENFIEDMFPTYLKGLTIERKNVNIGYCLENCSWATNSEQGFNRRKLVNNTSGKTGVSFIREKWHSYIYKDGKKIVLGNFADKVDAIRAREAAELELYGFIKE